AVIGDGRARQSSLLDGLREGVHDALGGLNPIPLQMTGKPRAIIEDADEHRLRPLPARSQHRPRADVSIPVDETADVLGLEAAYLAGGESCLCTLGAKGIARGEP